MSLNVKRARDREWSLLSSSSGLEMTLLDGEYSPTFASPATFLFRCAASVPCPVSVSDESVEYYVLSGRLNINGVELQEGDYAKLDPAADAQLSSVDGMEGICIQHGRALCGSGIFQQIKSASLKDDDTRKLMKLPWIDHLRRQASPAETDILCNAIKHPPSESVRELCINIARNINSRELCDAVRLVLKSPSSLGMRISALLFLASKDEVDANEWAKQLKVLGANEDELIQVVSSFYSVKDLSALRRIIEQRIASGNYQYNYPLYEFLINIIDARA